METDPMGTAVGDAPPGWTWIDLYIMVIVGKFYCWSGLFDLNLGVYYLYLEMCCRIGEHGHICLLGSQVVIVFCHLGHECYIGVSNVFHCRPVL